MLLYSMRSTLNTDSVYYHWDFVANLPKFTALSNGA
jgi:hypothetical protein